MMKTTLLNPQNHRPIQKKNLQKLIQWLACQLVQQTETEAWSEVVVILTDNEGITETNRNYFSKDRPTDVISFRYDPIPGEEAAWSGDILVNVQRAVEVGAEHEGIEYELALYIAHGFDHLSGADDDTPEQYAAMRQTETAWLTEARQRGLLDHLLLPVPYAPAS